MNAIAGMLLAFLKSALAKELLKIVVLEGAKILAERSDNKVDDVIVDKIDKAINNGDDSEDYFV